MNIYQNLINKDQRQSNDKENIMPNYNIGKRYNNLSSSNYSLNNSKKEYTILDELINILIR